MAEQSQVSNNKRTQIPKWNGKVRATVAKASADEIWPLFTDFFNIHKWFPNLPSSHGIHGTNGEPGCIRYCSGFSLPSTSSSSRHHVSWSKEVLTAVSHSLRALSYEIVDCNIGFQGYQSTVQIVPDDDGGGGCAIEWGFSVDAVEGWALDDLVARYEAVLKSAARKMEEAIVGSC